MKVVIYGATGMIGQGVLRECLLDEGVTEVLAVGRGGTGKTHAKLRELQRKDLLDYAGVEDQLAGYDACFFCLGITSVGTAEADYRRITLDYAVAAGNVLAARSPNLTFVFVSGRGTDPNSQTMWARVKGEAENAILALPFKAAYVFRPAIVQPLHGITSRTPAYRFFYALFRPLTPVLRALFRNSFATTEQVGRAMLQAARTGAPKKILESADIVRLAKGT
jgi:uncharacterized protein YbjT (DUF2867 family)